MPKDNEKDLPDIPEDIRKMMKLHFVDSMDEVLRIALEREMVALPMPPPQAAVDAEAAKKAWRIEDLNSRRRGEPHCMHSSLCTACVARLVSSM